LARRHGFHGTSPVFRHYLRSQAETLSHPLSGFNRKAIEGGNDYFARRQASPIGRGILCLRCWRGLCLQSTGAPSVISLMPTFQSGDTSPLEGGYEIALEPVTEVARAPAASACPVQALPAAHSTTLGFTAANAVVLRHHYGSCRERNYFRLHADDQGRRIGARPPSRKRLSLLEAAGNQHLMLFGA